MSGRSIYPFALPVLFVMTMMLAFLIVQLACAAPGQEEHERSKAAPEYRAKAWLAASPAFQGQPNLLLAYISQEETPVPDLPEPLKVRISHPESGSIRTYELTPVKGKPGVYQAVFTPDLSGEYRITLREGGPVIGSGTVHETAGTEFSEQPAEQSREATGAIEILTALIVAAIAVAGIAFIVGVSWLSGRRRERKAGKREAESV